MRSLRREIVMIIAQEGDTRAADLSQLGTEGRKKESEREKGARDPPDTAAPRCAGAGPPAHARLAAQRGPRRPVQSEVTPNALLSGPRAFHTEQLPPIAGTN
ncbi:unnamed protein product [Rangifer tarandus platyrhynchus]|uniref:Uncharacterized protein n=1 Tax=Rangifer tarandus platyrhynchus TaxID=3082113 RepID=A0AC59Z2S1_RANTA